MARTAVIALLSISIILQNTCLLGAEGRSVIFRPLSKECPMRCNSCCCRAESASPKGCAGFKAMEKSKPVISYFQMDSTEIAPVFISPMTPEIFCQTEDQIKHPFLDPPIKPPAISFHA